MALCRADGNEVQAVNDYMLAGVDMITVHCMFTSPSCFEARFPEKVLRAVATDLAKEHAMDKDRAQFRAAWTAWFGSHYADTYFANASIRHPGGASGEDGDGADRPDTGLGSVVF